MNGNLDTYNLKNNEGRIKPTAYTDNHNIFAGSVSQNNGNSLAIKRNVLYVENRSKDQTVTQVQSASYYSPKPGERLLVFESSTEEYDLYALPISQDPNAGEIQPGDVRIMYNPNNNVRGAIKNDGTLELYKTDNSSYTVSTNGKTDILSQNQNVFKLLNDIYLKQKEIEGVYNTALIAMLDVLIASAVLDNATKTALTGVKATFSSARNPLNTQLATLLQTLSTLYTN